jgi:hypothetical protein
MSTEATFVQGDTGPDLTAILHDEDDATSPIDLTGAAVRFQMRKENDKRFTVNQPATVLSAAAGEVSYSWAVNDLAVPGDYQVQWEIVFPDGKIQTQAVPSTITVRRQ